MCSGGAFNPHGSARRPRISLRTLRFLRLTGWPLLTALSTEAAKLKRFSNHVQFWHRRPYRRKQQHAHVGQFGERVLDHWPDVAPIQSTKPASKRWKGNRADAQSAGILHERFQPGSDIVDPRIVAPVTLRREVGDVSGFGEPAIVEAVLAWFCSALNDGRPDSSKATISPSMTVSSGISASARAIAEYLCAKSLSFRDRRCKRRPLLIASARYPSSFNSYAHEPPSGNFSAGSKSMGSMKGALIVTSDIQH